MFDSLQPCVNRMNPLQGPEPCVLWQLGTCGASSDGRRACCWRFCDRMLLSRDKFWCEGRSQWPCSVATTGACFSQHTMLQNLHYHLVTVVGSRGRAAVPEHSTGLAPLPLRSLQCTDCSAEGAGGCALSRGAKRAEARSLRSRSQLVQEGRSNVRAPEKREFEFENLRVLARKVRLGRTKAEP
jgi:hypothetical protein